MIRWNDKPKNKQDEARRAAKANPGKPRTTSL
jgi:hypothetical protein